VLAAIIANGNVLDPTVTDTGVNIFANGLDTRTQGVDIVMTYASDFGEYGAIDWSLAGSYTKTDVTRIAPPPSGLAAGVALFDATAISDLETASPEYRVVAGALWNAGSSVNTKATLYGPSSEMLSADGATYYKTQIDERIIIDLDISYAVTDAVTVSLRQQPAQWFRKNTIRRCCSSTSRTTTTRPSASMRTSRRCGIDGGYFRETRLHVLIPLVVLKAPHGGAHSPVWALDRRGRCNSQGPCGFGGSIGAAGLAHPRARARSRRIVLREL